MINTLLTVFSNHLLEVMSTLMGFALIFRYITHRYAKKDELYFYTFAREIEKRVCSGETRIEVCDPSVFMREMLGDIKKQLPKRSVRNTDRNKKELYQGREAASLGEYAGGHNSLIHGLQDETSVFRSQHPPNFAELTHRLMSQDEHWTKVFGFLPIEKITRMIDVLPGIFVVLGVFGTFVGISMALPEIAQIDFQNIDGSSEVISSFVLKVTFAMNTSIVGIVGSLTLTFINTLFPIKDTRVAITRKVRNSLEHLWHFFQADKEVLILNNNLQDMKEVLRKIAENTDSSNRVESKEVA